MYLLIKILLTAGIVAAVTEVSRRSSIMAAVLVSLPLTSILAFFWMYYEGADNAKIIELSYSVFWLVLPSLLFLVTLPWLLKQNFSFPSALIISCLIMSATYGGFIYFKKLFFAN